MNTTSNRTRLVGLALGVAGFLGGCLPGPWDYSPSNTPAFRGITMSAYAIADRPATDICFERQLSLTESSTDAAAFYDSALVTISGVFDVGNQVLTLTPKDVPPNCFIGLNTVRFVRGNSYTINARFVWDSAGNTVTSTLTAIARIPANFSVKDTAYATALIQTGVALPNVTDPAVFMKLPPVTRQLFLEKYGDTLTALDGDSVGLAAWMAENEGSFQADLLEWLVKDKAAYRRGDSVFYLAAKFNFSEMSHYFGTTRTSDVKGVLISRRFDTTESRPETSFDTIGGFTPTLSQFYQDGNMNRLIFYSEFPTSGGRNILDSLAVVNAWYWSGRNRLFFYGTEEIYSDYITNLEEMSENPKIRLPTNVTGGRGFFTGMVVDSFDVYLKLDGKTQAIPYAKSRVAACREKGWYNTRDCIGYYREFCRDTLWSVPTCKREAAYTSLDPVESLTLPQEIQDSLVVWKAADSLLMPESATRYCIDNNYPAGVAACASIKTQCETGSTGNGCQLILWNRCQIGYWKLPACTEGIKSYCSAKRDIAKTLCRDVPNP